MRWPRRIGPLRPDAVSTAMSAGATPSSPIGRQRAFCHLSQIDIVRNTTPGDHEGHVYAFRIIEYREGGRNLIVSRRALQARAAEVRKSIVPDAVLTGRVISAPDLGAFVELEPGVFEILSIDFEKKRSGVAKTFPVGSDVEVEVLEADAAGRGIRLSRSAVLDAQGRDDLPAYDARTAAEASRAFGGSLADNLRGALGPRKE